jgi:hypothetical protein
MAKFEKGNKKGYKTLFTSDNQPVNRGRKPRLYTIAKKKYNISHEEYKDVIAYLMQCTKKEINSIAEDENTPIWIVNVCRALYKDSGRGEVKTLNDITERIFGKIPNTTEITGKDGKDLIPKIDIEIIDKREDVEHEDTDY